MLAQLNSKQKSLFFNIKPTVIDKLISKNKSSIQNNLIYTNEDSDGSLSEDSEESSSSGQESNSAALEEHPVVMAPIRRSEKVLGSKLSTGPQFPIKRKVGRPPKNQQGRNDSNLRVIAAKKVLENSKRGSPKKVVRNARQLKVKRNVDEIPSTSVKRSRTCVKREDISSAEGTKSTNTSEDKSVVIRKKPKSVKDIKPGNTNEDRSPEINPMTLLNTKSSPRKFPSNIVDRWKSTGMVIRGRGRPRGSVRGTNVSYRGRGASFGGRGASVRGRSGKRLGALRSERYITRDSQIGLMRSGRRRKCSNADLVEGLEHSRRKRRTGLSRVKVEKCDYLSDEHSSFVTTSELSFCENDNSLKQSDDETINSRLVKVKEEILDTEDETVHSRDTNSNVFKGDKIKKENIVSTSGSDTNDQSNHSKTIRRNLNFGPRSVGQGRKRLISLERKVISQSDSSVRDSDCSVDSDFTEDVTSSPKSGVKLHKRRKVDGVWVRRSTRSIAKNSDKAEPDVVAIEELLKDKDFIVDGQSNSNSSLKNDAKTFELPIEVSSGENKSPTQNNFIRAVIETPIQKNIHSSNLVKECEESDKRGSPINELIKSVSESEPKTEVESSESNVPIDDSLTDFHLVLEETPIKNSNSILEMSKIPPKLNFDTLVDDNDEVLNDIKCLGSTHVSSDIVVDSSKEEKPELKGESGKAYIKSEQLEYPINESHVSDISSNSAEKKDQNYFLENSTGSLIIEPIIEKMCKKSEDGLGDSGNNSNEQVCSDREIISDEKILSMIDSFCSQSDATDISTDEGTQESTSVESEEKIILDSMNKITSEVENSILEEKGLRELTTAINNLSGNIINNCLESEKLPVTSGIEDVLRKGNVCSISITKESSLSGDLLAFTEEKREEKIEFLRENKQEITTSNICKEEISNSYENVGIDSGSMDKAPEITEESSSSDSNSNLSELMTISLENESENAKIQNSNDLELQNDGEGSKAPELLDKENEIASKKTAVDETEIQKQNFSSNINSDVNNKVEDGNKEINHAISTSLRISNADESLEERPSKELLSALGLQSLHSTAEDKPKRPNDSYTGTLKAVIKLNRSSDKRSGGRKIIFKQGDKLSEDIGGSGDRLEYRICSAEEISTESVPLTHLADIPANRKTQMKVKSQFDLSNSPNIVGSSGSAETSSDSTKDSGGKQNLIIPEKSSSFSIHPERLCTDVCSYCFGKFGSLDTPCHLAQLKNAERQSKILAIEVHLSADSCLCDGCFRYVDRKANCPTAQRSRKPAARRGPLAGTVCAVQECNQPARHSVRRKWLVKLKKSIGKKLVIDMDKNPHLPFPLCSQHYYWVDYFTVCGICKKRLTRNHMYALGPEAEDLNQALSDDGIPVRLSDKLFLCKLCRYYSSLRLKYRDPSAMSSTHRLFLNSYRKKILQYHDIPVSESEEEGKSVEEEGGCSEPSKSKKKKSKTKSLDGHDSKKRSLEKEGKIDHGTEDQSNDSQMIDYSYLDTLNIHREEPTTPTVEYSSLGDFEGQVGFSNIASFLNPLETGQGTVYPSDSQNRSRTEKPTRIQVKFGNLNIGKLSNLNIGQDSRPASSATPAVERPPYLPGERDLKLAGEFEFHGTLNPSSGWERCTSTIQFDRETKKLWQELQRPYGNQSSFLRHLVILEKHWRNGSLVLAENANPRAVKYVTSVKNRVQAYDGAKSSDVGMEKRKLPEVSVISPPPPRPPPVRSAPPPLMKIAPGSTPWLHEQLRKPPPYSSPATSTSRPVQAPPPPPYRLPKLGIRPIRLPGPSPSLKPNSNVRPLSISYQQFKKIRLETPVSVGQVTVVPKVEPVSSGASSSSDFSPLICDVRSLASPSSDWNESFRKQQQKMLKQNIAKYYTPILPKIPNSLTVTTFPQTTALVMKTSSLTIEKAPNVSTTPTIAPPEKPSISVFRETTPSDNG